MSSLGRAACACQLRLDGFFFLEAKEKPGTVVTRPFGLEGGGLQVNVDALDGYMKIEVLEASGEPIPGFSGDSAKVYRGFDNLRLNQSGKRMSFIVVAR